MKFKFFDPGVAHVVQKVLDLNDVAQPFQHDTDLFF
jgi:hypothetical protein